MNEQESLVVQEVLSQVYRAPKVETILPIEEYTNLAKLYRITNFIFKGLKVWYRSALKDQAREKCDFPSAEMHYLLAEQQQEYPLVIECLTNKRTQEQFAGTKKFIQDLSLVMDGQGILRSLGYFGNATEYQIADSLLSAPS